LPGEIGWIPGRIPYWEKNKIYLMRKKLLLFCFLVFLCLLGYVGYKRPFYNWDMLAYMAIILRHEHTDFEHVHAGVYSTIQHQLPSDAYRDLVDGDLHYRRSMAASAAQFEMILPFYLVKPLYTWLVFVFYKLGTPLIQATILPSVLGYVLLGGLLFVWVRKYLSGIYAWLFTTFLMLSSFVWELSRYSTPDAVSAFLMMGALFSLVERKSPILVFLCLFLAVLARLDNIIPAFFLLVLGRFYGRGEVEWRRGGFSLMTAMLVALFFFVTTPLSSYGWNPFYYPTFMKWLNLSYAYQPAFRPTDYFTLAISHLMGGLFYTYIFLFLALGVLAFYSYRNKTFFPLSFEQKLLLAILLSMGVRFILQPVIADRFFVPYYLLVILLFLRKLRPQEGIQRQDASHAGKGFA
jgi:hypothetical protein